VLDRRHRLTSSAGFTTATRRGDRAGSRTLVVHLWAGGSGRSEAGSTAGSTAGSIAGSAAGQAVDAGPRVGFVVSRAVGNAVTRNRVKRRLRELVRARLRSLPDAGLLVVRALPASAAASYADLARDLDKTLRRLGVASIEGVG
jgi:ribonuclease P protein component